MADYPSPDLSPCGCSVARNLPMFMEDTDGREWIECDFCGKRTANYQRTDNAVKQWNQIARY